MLAFATLSVLITIVQESRSERVLEALRNLASPRALVIRDGERIQIAGREVVCSDVIVISEGDRVAADAVLLASQDLMLDESLLTGESVAVRKLSSNPSAAVFWQPARSLFHFGRLHWDDLAICAAVGLFSLIVLEALKSRWFRVRDGGRAKAASPRAG